MELQDFLKVKKVRCVEGNYSHGLIKNGVYTVISTDYDEFFGKLWIKIDKNGMGVSYISDFFEPVLDEPKSDNAIDTSADSVDAPHVSEPKFKVGDKVYYGNENRILTIAEFDDDGWVRPDGWIGFIDAKKCCQATPENHALLCKLYPHIEFEQPPKPLTGSDLCRAMLDKGWKLIPCFTSRYSEEDALDDPLDNSLDNIDLIIGMERGYFLSVWGDLNEYAVPFNPKTGEPLTEAVLND